MNDDVVVIWWIDGPQNSSYFSARIISIRNDYTMNRKKPKIIGIFVNNYIFAIYSENICIYFWIEKSIFEYTFGYSSLEMGFVWINYIISLAIYRGGRTTVLGFFFVLTRRLLLLYNICFIPFRSSMYWVR